MARKNIKATYFIETAHSLPKAAEMMAGRSASTARDSINWCINMGFFPVRINASQAMGPEYKEQEEQNVMITAVDTLEKGNSVIIYTAMDPDDPEISRTRKIFANLGKENRGILVAFQGQVMKKIIESKKLSRAVVAGSDSSGYASCGLEKYTLEDQIPVATKAPLLTAPSRNPVFEEIIISLKNWQKGNHLYFESILKEKK